MTRAEKPLTAVEVKAARFPNHPTKLFDGGGLFLHIQKSGRYWRMKYRFANKERLLALGVYPQTSLKSVRKSRDDARELLAQGIDP